MRLLLDTHVLLWARNRPAMLSSRAREAIENPENQRFVSIASLWEVQIKHNLGKLKLEREVDRLAPIWLGDLVAEQLDINLHHVGALYELPLHHRDPFDRILIAQARVEQLTIVSRDPELRSYAAPLLW
jgi:PIN domain nuclease of toxin-antitoxin system